MSSFHPFIGASLACIISFGCSPDSPTSYTESSSNSLSKGELDRRRELLAPLAPELKEVKRNESWVRVAASLEGQPVSKVQELIELADIKRVDVQTGRVTYIFAPVPVLSNIEDPNGGDLTIVILNGKVEEATSSVLPEF